MKNFVFITFAFASTFTFAQTKLLTMEEAVRGQRTYLAPQKLEQLGWIPGTDEYYYVDTRKKTLMIGKGTGNAEPKVSLRQLNDAVRKFGMGMDTLSDFPVISWEGKTAFTFSGKSRIVYDITKGGTGGTLLDKGESLRENVDVASIHNTAFTKDNNLFIETTYTGLHTVQVTNDTDKDIVNGRSVHREEWGIYKGTFWSPNENYLAFYRMDQTMVTDYPILDLQSQPAKALNIKYPMAGGKSHHVTVGVYNIKSGTTVFLKTGGDPEHYLINPCWTPDEKHIYITELNRGQDHLKLNSYNAQTGEFEKTLLEEQNSKYVHPMNPPLFVKNHPDLFIWQSERKGYNSLYLYDTNGNLKRQLTNFEEPGERRSSWQIVTEVLGFNEAGDRVFYIAANTANVLGREIRSSALTTTNDVLVAGGTGVHSASLGPSGKFIIDTYSSPEVPRTISIIDAKGARKQTLLEAPNPLKDYKLGKIKIVPVRAADNITDLYIRVIYPIDFDSTKKYPVVDYLYNGPNVQLVNNSWLNGADLWFQYMAERGYLVVTMDGRGSGFRGLEFEQCTFRKLGREEMNDQVKVIDYLKSKSYVDQARLGVFGWSFGGFMTTSLMTRHPGIFKCAVAGGPVIDWSYYEVMYTERYMDTPQENPEGYKENSLLNYAGNLKGKLLLIHGTSDPVVVWQHSLLFLQKCVEKGTHPDYLVYPGHEHNVLGKDRTHLYEKVTEYFMQNL
jgi:dipeptidyl-peptidase-4